MKRVFHERLEVPTVTNGAKHGVKEEEKHKLDIMEKKRPGIMCRVTR